MLKIRSILDSIILNVSTQKLYGLWITDWVIGGSLLNILKGAPITKIKSRNGIDRIKIKLFLIEKFICGERGIRTLDTLSAYTHFPGVLLQPLGHLSNPQLMTKLMFFYF